jgi:hypothetical protein
MTDQERRASEARRILEDVEPYLAQIRAEYLDHAAGASMSMYASIAELQADRLRILDKAELVNELRNKLKTEIELGKQAARPKMAVA